MQLDARTKSNLNYLKAFAAFLVVLGHGLSYYAESTELSTGAGLLENMIYLVHVPLFFVIAGFLCHAQPVGAFYKKKVLRLLVPFWFFAFLKLVYSNLISGKFAHASTLAGQLYDAFIVGQVYWFAYAMMLMFLLAPLFWEKNADAAPKKAMIALAVTVLYNILSSALHFPSLPRVFQMKNTLQYLPYFLSGLVLRFYYPKLRELFRRRRALILCGALLVTAASACAYLFDWPVDPYARKLVSSYALMILLLALADILPENRRLPTLAAGFSYQSMLLDPFFKVVLFAVCGKLLGVTLPAVFLIAALDYAAGIVTCTIARKIPLLNRLTGLK